MKRKIFITGIALAAFVFIAGAQNPDENRINTVNQGVQCDCPNFIDANNDGVCDNYEEGGSYGLGNGKGKAEGANYGRGAGQGYRHGQSQGLAKGRVI